MDCTLDQLLDLQKHHLDNYYSNKAGVSGYYARTLRGYTGECPS